MSTFRPTRFRGPTVNPASDPGSAPARKPRRWRDKFHEALRGVKLGVRGQTSFYAHFFAAALAIAAGVALECEAIEWCLLVGCIGAVFTAELFNSCLETLFHALDRETKARMTGCLDIAAGAVLVASITAAVIGAIIFGRRIAAIFG
jgi:diacylglycerol kinase